MALYESTVIHTFADRLYQQASRIVAQYVVMGLLIGGGIGLAFGLAARLNSTAMLVVAGVGAVIASAIGYSIGDQKAFALKLMAQQALCQLQIEYNTRPPA